MSYLIVNTLQGGLTMQECQKFSKQFTWKNIIKSRWFLIGYKPIKCDSSNTEHCVNSTTKWFYSILTIGVPFLFFYSRERSMRIWGLSSLTRGNITNLPSYYLLVYLQWVALIICLTPFYARFNENKK